MPDCLFCKIVAGEVPASIRYQDEAVLAFDDIHPKAPVHILVVPKQHLQSLAHAGQNHESMLGQVLLAVSTVAKQLGLSGYKVQINTGREGGQVVDHLHLHLIGGSTESQIGLSGHVPDDDM